MEFLLQHNHTVLSATSTAFDGKFVLALDACRMAISISFKNKFSRQLQHYSSLPNGNSGIFDDTFLTMGSANLNYRSMRGDSELNIVLECDKVAHKMRFDLWKLHTSPITRDKENGMPDSTTERKNMQKVNPSYHWKDNVHNPEIANDVFGEWQSMLDKNRNLEKRNKPPQQPLREFYNSTTNWSSTD